MNLHDCHECRRQPYTQGAAVYCPSCYDVDTTPDGHQIASGEYVAMPPGTQHAKVAAEWNDQQRRHAVENLIEKFNRYEDHDAADALDRVIELYEAEIAELRTELRKLAAS